MEKLCVDCKHAEESKYCEPCSSCDYSDKFEYACETITIPAEEYRELKVKAELLDFYLTKRRDEDGS